MQIYRKLQQRNLCIRCYLKVPLSYGQTICGSNNNVILNKCPAIETLKKAVNHVQYCPTNNINILRLYHRTCLRSVGWLLPGTWSHLWFAGVRECPPWCSIVGATLTVHQFFCILHILILLPNIWTLGDTDLVCGMQSSQLKPFSVFGTLPLCSKLNWTNKKILFSS